MIVNKQTYVTSEWNEEFEYYINSWYGIVEEEDFIKAVNIGKDFMIENKVKYHLADTSNMETGWNGGEWLYENFWKSVTQAGLKYFGIIVPESNILNVTSDFLMQDEMRARGIEITYRTFHSLSDAENWIKEMKEHEGDSY